MYFASLLFQAPTYLFFACSTASNEKLGRSLRMRLSSFMLRLMIDVKWQHAYTLAADQAILGMLQRVDLKGEPYSTCCVGLNQQLKNKFLPLN